MFIDRCRLVRELLDNPAITTDIIVGFPGETEADFESTCRVSRECGFSKIHIFPFSPRKDTPAAEMNDMVSPQEKSDRHQQLATLEAELRQAYFHSLIGRQLTVLVENAIETIPGGWVGTSCRYAPVEISSSGSLAGQLLAVEARELRNGMVVCSRSSGVR